MKFTVTIPAYKRKFLNEAIRSVINQRYTDWELVIVDDCSPEDLDSVIKPYLGDKRIHHYRNEKNCGAINVVDNWNICLSHTTGDYVICMGDDDRLLPCCLEEYAKLITKYPDLKVYHCRTELINEAGDVIDVQESRPEWESAIAMLWNRWATRDKQFIGDFCYHTESLKKEGGYYKLPLAWGSDDLTAIRAADSLGIANTQEFCFQYRVNTQTISSSGNAIAKMDATVTQYQLLGKFIEEKRKSKLSDEDAEYLRTIEEKRWLYYYRSIGQNCVDEMRGNPFKIYTCMKKLRIFKYSKYIFFRFYITSLLIKLGVRS